MQQTVASMVNAVGNVFLRAYEIKQDAIGDRYFEVLLGATANQQSRREDLLHDARNLLIDLEPICGINFGNYILNSLRPR